ncbi:PEP-CTERM sorting domain-containing protein [Parahaliea mediterranea]|uniref:PEP-CTERM sorting domain-containing protein n=1 Tax=Parahaliea mediterranea TaxID=651086 RepID=UPI000E2F19EB|nr:PEP-CTERM sorting domain-containing protein [Parahaliea mediterranea]
MKKITPWIAGIAASIFAFAVNAAPINVFASYENSANAQLRSGVMAGLYELKVDGITILAMCDDFNTHVTPGQTWDALLNDFSDIQAGGGKFNPGNNVKYSQAGYLMSLAPSMNYTQQADMNLAIWNIFTPNAIAMNTQAQTYFNTATSGSYDTFNWSGIMQVLTPNPLGASQEFLVLGTINKVPEPGTLALVALGLVGASLRIRKKAAA